MPDSPTIKDFESAIAELETIVKTLEEGDLALERSLELFERGVQLLADNELHPALPAEAMDVIKGQVARVVTAQLKSPGYLV